MKKNPLGGILFLIVAISGVLFFKNTIKTSDNQVAKDMLLVGDIFTTIRFIFFVGIMLVIIWFDVNNKLK